MPGIQWTADCESELIRGPVPGLVCLQLAKGGAAPYLLTALEHADAIKAWWHHLVDGDDEVVGLNIAFDLVVLAVFVGDVKGLFKLHDEGRVRDCMIRQRLWDIENGRPKAPCSMADCARVWLDVRGLEKKPPKKALAAVLGGDWSMMDQLPPRFKYERLRHLPLRHWPQEYVSYALDDVVLTRDIYNAQSAVLGPVAVDEVAQCKANLALYLTAATGVYVDQDAVDVLEAKLLKQVDEAETKMIEHGLMNVKRLSRGPRKGLEVRSKNTKAIQSLVQSALGPKTPLTPSGAVSTEADTLKAALAECIGRGEPTRGLRALLDQAKPAKMLSTYVKALRAAGIGTLHTSYRVLLASGRTSSSAPNLQNLPRKGGIRECIIPGPGNILGTVDYDSIEFYSLAYVCDMLGFGDTMKLALNAGLDPHLLVASQLIELSYEAAKARFDAGDDEVANLRQLSKIANYGFAGGMSAKTFIEYAAGYGVEVSEDMANCLYRAFMTAWPEMNGYFEHIGQLVGRDRGTVEQFGSRRRRGGCKYCQAANTYFQGLTADMVKDALYEVCRECFGAGATTALTGYRPVVMVHDEIIIEGPVEGAEAALDRLAWVMVDAGKRHMPGMAIKASGKLMTRWTK